MFDEGSGPAIVVIPGVQGRWEWMRPALRALSARCRVISYSLGAAKTFDDLVAQVDRVLDERGVQAAAICGVSFGGLIAHEVRGGAARADDGAGRRLDAVAGVDAVGRQQARYLDEPVAVDAGVSRDLAGPDVAGDRRGDRRLAVAAAVLRRTRRRGSLAAPIVPAQMAARMKLSPGIELRGRLRAGARADAGDHRRSRRSIASSRRRRRASSSSSFAARNTR